MANDLASFEEAGYPTITLICFAIVLLLGFFACRNNFNLRSGKNGGIAGIVIAIFLLAAAVFLTFGPAGMRRLSIHLFILGVSGLFGVATGNSRITYFNLIFGLITFMCLIGSAAILGYGSQMHHVSSADCNLFFTKPQDVCKDDGYLQWLRVISVVSYYVVAAQIVLGLTSQENEPSSAAQPAQPAQPTAAV